MYSAFWCGSMQRTSLIGSFSGCQGYHVNSSRIVLMRTYAKIFHGLIEILAIKCFCITLRAKSVWQRQWLIRNLILDPLKCQLGGRGGGMISEGGVFAFVYQRHVPLPPFFHLYIPSVSLIYVYISYWISFSVYSILVIADTLGTAWSDIRNNESPPNWRGVW